MTLPVVKRQFVLLEPPSRWAEPVDALPAGDRADCGALGWVRDRARVGDIATSDDVVFAEPGDLALLGSRTLGGLNVRIDPISKQLVDAGPAPAAAGA